MIVEDGTGKTDSNSYVSVFYADAYFLASGSTTWTGLDAAKEAALVRGARALDGMKSWPGVKMLSTQAMAWPRSEAVDANGYTLSGVPEAIKRAQCEAALLELVEAGTLTPEIGGPIIEETVGPITTKYGNGTQSSVRYSTIESALSDIIGRGLMLVRG